MNTEHNDTMPTPAHVRRLIAELNAAGYEVRPIASSPPADNAKVPWYTDNGGRAYGPAAMTYRYVAAKGEHSSPPADPARVLTDPNGGCSCQPFDQDAGGGYTEHLLEYEPDCPEHSTHLYDPRKGEWILDPRGTVNRSDAGPLGSGHSPSVDTATRREDSGGSVEEPSTHLIHGTASSPPADDVREALESTIQDAWTVEEDGDLRSDVQIAHLILTRFEVSPRRTASSPADDVREALAKILTGLDDREWAIATADGHPHLDGYYEAADRILAAFDVRPYGTVTDPSDVQVLAALNATVKPESAAPDLSFWGEESAAQMRASLKAAAEVRERAEA